MLGCKSHGCSVLLNALRGEEEIGRWPVDAPMLLKYAGPDIELENWLI
jgi:hypothetical protein